MSHLVLENLPIRSFFFVPVPWCNENFVIAQTRLLACIWDPLKWTVLTYIPFYCVYEIFGLFACRQNKEENLRNLNSSEKTLQYIWPEFCFVFTWNHLSIDLHQDSHISSASPLRFTASITYEKVYVQYDKQQDY